MTVEKRILSDGTIRWRVRWRQGDHHRARVFDRKRDAKNFEAELRRRSQVGTLSMVDSGRMTLAEYVSGTWARAYASNLAPATRKRYGHIYDKHILPELIWRAGCQAGKADFSRVALVGGVVVGRLGGWRSGLLWRDARSG